MLIRRLYRIFVKLLLNRKSGLWFGLCQIDRGVRRDRNAHDDTLPYVLAQYRFNEAITNAYYYYIYKS